MTKEELRNDIEILEGIIKEVSNELLVHQKALMLAVKDVVSLKEDQDYITDLEDESYELVSLVRGLKSSLEEITAHNKSLVLNNSELKEQYDTLKREHVQTISSQQNIIRLLLNNS